MPPRTTSAKIKLPRKGREPTVQAPSGATFDPKHMVRPMKVFPVHQSEITSLSLLNNLVAGFLAGAFSLFFLGVGVVLDLAIEGRFGEAGLGDSDKVLLYCVVPILGVLALILAGAGILAIRKRRSTWEQIESESKEVS